MTKNKCSFCASDDDVRKYLVSDDGVATVCSNCALMFAQYMLDQKENESSAPEENQDHKEEPINSNMEKALAKKEAAFNPEKVPPVIPLIQTEVGENGTAVTKRVKPLTYSLMSWVKHYMNLPDTIDIADDEDSAQFEISVPSPDEDFSYSCYFNTDEENGFIMFYMYYFDDLIPEEREEEVKNLVLDSNLNCMTGQLQIMESQAGKSIRYCSGICVKGIASEDPDYSGEFQISPMLYQNMFEGGIHFMNIFVGELKNLLNED